jgi:hypothetical protein
MGEELIYSAAERPHNGSPPSSHEATGSSEEGASAGDNSWFKLSTRPGQSCIHYSRSAREYLCIQAVTETIVISVKLNPQVNY